MRSRYTMLIGVLLLIAGALGGAQSASAAAQRYTVSECVNSDNGFTLCYEERGVAVARQTPSGREVSVTVSTFSYTLSLNGEIVSSDTTKGHYVQTSEGGVVQVDKFNVRRTLTYTDPETGKTQKCANSFVFVYAQNDVRHEDERIECPVEG